MVQQQQQTKPFVRAVNRADGHSGLTVRIPPDSIDYLEIEFGDRVAIYHEVDPRTKDKVLIIKKVKL